MFAGLLILLKALFYSGCLLAIGVGFHASLKLIEGRTWLRWASLILVGSLLLRLFALNLEMVGAIEDAFDFSMFSWLWPSVKYQIVTMLLGAVALWVASLRGRRIWAIIGAGFIAAGFGLTGHTQSLEDAVWAPFVVALHAAIAGFWVLAPVSLWPRRTLSSETLILRLRRFSQTAVWSVPLMTGLGLWLSVMIAGSITELFQSNYGRVLLVKLAAAVFAIGLGGFNKIYLTEILQTSQNAMGRRYLRRSLTVEACLFILAIIAVAAATTTLGPNME